jgi:hypothetical protein
LDKYCAGSKTPESFADGLKTLKMHRFKIIEGVDIEEVSTFVSWIESSETLTEETKEPNQLEAFVEGIE